MPVDGVIWIPSYVPVTAMTMIQKNETIYVTQRIMTRTKKFKVKYISKRIGCTWCKKEMTFSQWEKHISMNTHLDKAFENAYMWKYGVKKK